MNVTVTGNEQTPNVRVTLSRRNLQHLLRMLDEVVGNPTLCRRCDEISLYVTAEEDDEHYGERVPGPGADSIRRPRGFLVFPQTGKAA